MLLATVAVGPPRSAANAATPSGGTFSYAIPEPGAIDPGRVTDVFAAELASQFANALASGAVARTGNGSLVATESFYPTGGSPYVTTKPCANATFNQARAKKLLADSGGIPGNSLTLLYPTGGPNDAAIKAIANDWKVNLGLQVQLKGVEFPQFLDAIHSGKVTGPMSLGWAWDYPSAYNFLSPLYESTAADNYGRYASAGFDRLMAGIRTAPTEKEGGR